MIAGHFSLLSIIKEIIEPDKVDNACYNEKLNLITIHHSITFAWRGSILQVYQKFLTFRILLHFEVFPFVGMLSTVRTRLVSVR